MNTYNVTYPSGKVLVLTGKLVTGPVPGYKIKFPMVFETDDTPTKKSPVTILDPRSVITCDGLVVYNGKNVKFP